MAGGPDAGAVLVPLLVVLGLAAVVVVLVLGHLAERRRRERLLLWTVDRAWDHARTDPRLVDLLPDEPFGRGHSRAVTDVVRGRWDGRDAFAFGYRFKVTSGSGKDRRTRTYDHTVVALHLPVPLPRVHVGPEGLFHRLAQAFGADDIDVESHEFNRRYRVQARDRRAAVAILHPRLVELLTAAEPVEWRTDLSAVGPLLLSWDAGRPEPALLQRRLALLSRVADAVPDWLWREHGWEPRPRTGGPAAPGADPGPDGPASP